MIRVKLKNIFLKNIHKKHKYLHMYYLQVKKKPSNETFYKSLKFSIFRVLKKCNLNTILTTIINKNSFKVQFYNSIIQSTDYVGLV